MRLGKPRSHDYKMEPVPLMVDGLEVLSRLRDVFCERPFKFEDARALLSNSKLLGCLLEQLEEDRSAIRSRAIRPVLTLEV